MINERDRELLTNMLTMNEGTLYKFMYLVLKKHYKKEDIICTADYIIAKGNIPIAVLAHMDTVFSKKPSLNSIFFDKEKGVMWSPDGLGTDDRAGTFLIAKLVQQYRPTVILTLGEEKGGIGAARVIADYPTNEFGVKFMVELDRQGTQDSVYYDCGNAEFEKFINSYGFETDWGTFTDISVIAPVWDVAAVNLSVGYIDEHTRQERIYLNCLSNTLEKVKRILSTYPKDAEFPFCKKKWYEYTYYSDSVGVICGFCGKQHNAEACIPYMTKNGSHKYICTDCFEKEYRNFNWCGFCGEAFDPKDPEDTFCPNCANKIFKAEDRLDV